MPTMTPDAIADKAAELAGLGDRAAAVAALLAASGPDRPALEEARDRLAARLHHRSDDWSATGALTVVNAALSNLPRNDPLDWRVRWAHHRKP